MTSFILLLVQRAAIVAWGTRNPKPETRNKHPNCKKAKKKTLRPANVRQPLKD